MSYSVVIPSRNIANLTKCMHTLRNMGEICPAVVVWDGVPEDCPDGALDLAADGYGSRVTQGVSPFVFARNCNIGIRASGTDDVVLLNDDCLLKTPDGLFQLSCLARQHPEYGAISPGFTPGSVGTPDLVWRNRPILAEVKTMLVFACVYIPRQTIDHVGGLDERFGVNAGGPRQRGYGCEDDDYSLRIRQAGLKLGVYDGVLVDHVPESTGLKSTFRHDPEHKADVRAHEELFRKIHGHWPEGHGYAPR